MHLSLAHTALALLAAAGVAIAKTVVITVGQAGLAFSPNISTAQTGDTLEFQFTSSSHTVVQGDPNNPCQRTSTGFNSSPINSSYVFQVTVTDTNPIFFYCSTPSHCQRGMVGVVNQGSGESLSDYRSKAALTSNSEFSKVVQGGVVVLAGTSSSSSSSPSSAAPNTAPSAASNAASGTTTAKSTSSTPNGAMGAPSSVFAAHGAMASLTVGLCLLVFLMV